MYQCQKKNKVLEFEKPKNKGGLQRKKQNLSNISINRMDEAFLRFPHFPEQIFEQLDDGSILSSRLVARS